MSYSHPQNRREAFPTSFCAMLLSQVLFSHVSHDLVGQWVLLVIAGPESDAGGGPLIREPGHSCSRAHLQFGWKQHMTPYSTCNYPGALGLMHLLTHNLLHT